MVKTTKKLEKNNHQILLVKLDVIQDQQLLTESKQQLSNLRDKISSLECLGQTSQ